MIPIVFSFVLFFVITSARIVLPPNDDGSMNEPNVTCEYAVDIAQVIDITESQFGNIDNIKQVLVDNVAVLENFLPESRSALAIFTDKPIVPLGFNRTNYQDYCLKMRATFEDPISKWSNALSKITAAGGFDFPEGQMEALIRVAMTKELKWRNENTTPQGRHYVRAALIITDSLPHVDGHALKAINNLNLNGANLPLPYPNNIHVPGVTDQDLNIGCGEMEYPKFATIGNVLKDKYTIPVFMVAPAAYKCDTGLCLYPEMRDLYAATGNSDYLDPMKGMVLAYETVLEKLGVPGVVQELGYGFTGLAEKFLEVLKEIGLIPTTCEERPETTAPPTTTTAMSTFGPPRTSSTSPTTPTTTKPTTQTTTTPTTKPTTTATTTQTTTTKPTTTATTTQTTTSTTTKPTTTATTTQTTTSTTTKPTTTTTTTQTTITTSSTTFLKTSSSSTEKRISTSPSFLTSTVSTLSSTTTKSTVPCTACPDCNGCSGCCGPVEVEVNVKVKLGENGLPCGSQ